jgi:hypothetical protein
VSRSTLLIVVCALLSAAPAAAQSRLSVLRGTVLTDSAELPIRGAEVIVTRLRLRAVTDADGTFRISGIPAGREIVQVRRLGYQQITTQIDFKGDTVDVDLLLSKNAQKLSQVNVRGEARSRLMIEFTERMNSGQGGHFMDEAKLAKMQGRSMGEILSGIPGPTVYRGTYSSAAWVGSGRGQQSVAGVFQLDQADKSRGAPPNQCWAAVFIDGAAVFTGGVGQLLFDINSIDPTTIAGIEYYAGNASIPSRFNSSRNTCGALLIWMK